MTLTVIPKANQALAQTAQTLIQITLIAIPLLQIVIPLVATAIQPIKLVVSGNMKNENSSTGMREDLAKLFASGRSRT